MSLNKFTDSQKGIDLKLKIGCDELKCNTLDVGGEPLIPNAQAGFVGASYPVDLSTNDEILSDNSNKSVVRGSIFTTFTNSIETAEAGIYLITGFADLDAPTAAARATLSFFSNNGADTYVQDNQALVGSGNIQTFKISEVLVVPAGGAIFLQMSSNVFITVNIHRWKLSMVKLSRYLI